MNYKQFRTVVKLCIEKSVGKNREVLLKTVVKNNDVEKYGIVIKAKGEKIAITVYLEEFYDLYLQGMSLDDIVENIILMSNTKVPRCIERTELVKDFEQIKDKIMYRLVNADDNDYFLSQNPHRKKLNLAIVYYVLVAADFNNCVSVIICNNLLDLWGIDEEELYKIAHKNTQSKLKYSFNSLEKVIHSICGDMTETKENNNDPMFVLTNQYSYFGAAALLYDDLLEKIAKEVEDDFYILPSSVHELIIVAKKSAPFFKLLLNIVIEENERIIKKDEILSNKAYFYSRDKGLGIYE